jgi:hypothetical protein
MKQAVANACLLIDWCICATLLPPPQIGTVREPKLRVQIVSQRSVFDEDPSTFRAKYEDSQK